MSALIIEDKPPSLTKKVTPPKTRDLPRVGKPWKDVKLPIDIMLLTVKDCEFLSCYKLLKNSFKSYTKALGVVYFGEMGVGEPLKVALMKCQEGANTTGGSTIVVKNAVTILQPKTVFAVGCCNGLKRCTTRLGDVVVCSKITQYAPRIVQSGEVQSTGAARVPLSRNMLQLITYADAGWNPPLLDPSPPEIKVHCDAEYLSGPEFVCDEQRCDELTRLYPNAKAIDMEGEGVYVAAHDLKMEWVVVKGISGYADGTGGVSDEWKTFASVMAASVVENMLSDSAVFQSWPHFEDNSDTADGSPRKRRRSSSPSGSDPKRKKSTAAPVKAGGPSIDELEDLSLELGGKWEELGGRLRFNQAAITGFDADNRGLKKKAFKMLMAWKQREGSNATYKVLCDALCDKKVQCTLLAEQFCCE